MTLSFRGSKGRRSDGFTLIELLVVVAIIALLIAILVPSLAAARNQARKAACAANLHAVGQGLATYATEYGAYPLSYYYAGQFDNNSMSNLTVPSKGYVHWSQFIYGNPNTVDGSTNNGKGATSSDMGRVPAKAFQCPMFVNGGLRPTNTTNSSLLDGFQSDVSGIDDYQVPRIAYTLNEAICGRNKMPPASDWGAIRTYRWVKPSEVNNAQGTILSTEFTTKEEVVMAAGDVNGQNVVKSHRPVHGFIGADGELDMAKESYASGGGMFGGGRGKTTNLYRIGPNDIPTVEPGSQSSQGGSTNLLSRLDWVGRNHGSGSFKSKTTNFLYVDGHVENKLLIQTVQVSSFEWGDQFYSLSPNDDLAPLGTAHP